MVLFEQEQEQEPELVESPVPSADLASAFVPAVAEVVEVLAVAAQMVAMASVLVVGMPSAADCSFLQRAWTMLELLHNLQRCIRRILCL